MVRTLSRVLVCGRWMRREFFRSLLHRPPSLVLSGPILRKSTGGVCAALALCLIAAHANAATNTWTVGTTNDDTATTSVTTATTNCGSASTCTLRDAILAASADSGDTIDITATGTITLGAVLPTISENLTIAGPGANQLTITASAAVTGIFAIASTESVTISGVTLASGSQGAISNNGILTVLDCAFSGNNFPAGLGAAIANNGGTLVVNGSTFYDNSTVDGGAIFTNDAATIIDSTFYGNSATNGGAVYESAGTLTATNNTFVGNSADASGGLGGAIDVRGGALVANNNIFMGNSSDSGGGAINNDGTANGSNNVYYQNLTSGAEDDCRSCNSGSPSQDSNIDASSSPLTLPFGYYGGTTETFLPQPLSGAVCAGSSSLAVDAGDNSLTIDQRGDFLGTAYCANGSIDSGAVQTNYLVVTNLNSGTDTTPSCTSGTGTTCSLADAIHLANAATATQPGPDITFAATLTKSGAATITLAAALPAISAQANIVGPAASLLTVSGNKSATVGSVFTVDSGAGVTLYGLTIEDGNATVGGGVNNSGMLLLMNSAVANNAASSNGGGVNNSGSVTVEDSTISGNTAGGSGGGVENTGTGSSASMIESTVYDNSTLAASGAEGGGIDIGNGSMTIVNGTITGNEQLNGTGAGGGGIAVLGSLTLKNSIVSGNTDASGNAADILDTYTNDGGNLVGGTVAFGSLFQLNGIGATVPTMIPSPGSTAICAGKLSNVTSAITTDERGYPLQPDLRYCAAGDVDAGAVQTAYSGVMFVQQPAGATSTTTGSVDVSTNMTTPAIVQVLEADTLLSSNNTDGVDGIAVSLSSAGGNLSNPSATTTGTGASAGEATFTNLQVTRAAMDDTLTAAITVTPLSVSPALTLSATSDQFDVVGAASRLVVSGAPSSVAAGAPFSLTVTAEDSAGNTATGYTGTVAFSNSPTIAGEEVLPGNYTFTAGDKGVHTFTNAFALSAGNQTVTATDASTASVMGSAQVTVTQDTTSLTVTSSENSGTTPVTFTFTATLQAPTGTLIQPTGTVDFTENGNSISNTSGGTCDSVTLGNWDASTATATATCTTNSLGGGNHAVIATYSGDTNYMTSSGSTTQKVGTVATTTTMAALLAGQTTPTVNETVTITANVAPTSGTLTVAFSKSGTIEFFDDGTPISNCTAVPITDTSTGATASCPVNGLTASSTAYTFTAEYLGDTSYNTSTSTAGLDVTVIQDTSNVGLTSSAPSGSVVNQPVTFTATVTAGTSGSLSPTGYVEFTDNTAAIASCGGVNGVKLTSGVVTCTDSVLTSEAGGQTHSITAKYLGDTNFSASSLAINQAVSQASTSIALSSSLNPSVLAQSVTFTATITPSNAGANVPSASEDVVFADSVGTSPICTSQITVVNSGMWQATCVATDLPVNTSGGIIAAQTITASYAGDANFSSSSATLAQTVEPATSSIALGAAIGTTAATTWPVNTSVTFKAQFALKSGITSLPGTLMWTDSLGQTLNCPATATVDGSNGVATCTLNYLEAGSHTISLAYTNDTSLSLSPGAITVNVTPATTATIQLAGNPNPSIFGQTVVFTATIAAPSGAAVPLASTGAVVAFTGTGVSCPAQAVTSGMATCTVTALPDSANTITATYSGDPNYASVSTPATESVEDFSISMANVPKNSTGVVVTQGYTTSSDPFSLGAPAVVPASVGGYASSGVAITCSSTSAGAPACTPGGNSDLVVDSSGTEPTLGLTIDATGASVVPGTYTFTVTAKDSATSLIRTTAFAVTVRPGYTAATGKGLTLESGATTKNTASLTFAPPSTVTLSNPTCLDVAGTGLSAPTALASANVGMSCSFSQLSGNTTTITVGTNTPISATTAKLRQTGSRSTTFLLAGVFGIPLFGLLGLVRGRNSVSSRFLRMIAFVVIGIAAIQTMGCAASFSTSTKTAPNGTTPPGTYYLQVQATGSDGNTYQAVLQVNVTL